MTGGVAQLLVVGCLRERRFLMSWYNSTSEYGAYRSSSICRCRITARISRSTCARDLPTLPATRAIAFDEVFTMVFWYQCFVCVTWWRGFLDITSRQLLCGVLRRRHLAGDGDSRFASSRAFRRKHRARKLEAAVCKRGHDGISSD